jgi:hypothetical protein
MAVTLKRENTAVLASVIVIVIVSALPVSSDTKIDLTSEVVAEGAVYSTVSVSVVKSTFAFL